LGLRIVILSVAERSMGEVCGSARQDPEMYDT